MPSPHPPDPASDDTFDYVIVGAGSAGCVLAERLSADPGVRVALIEAGPAGWAPGVTMPRAWVALGGSRHWRYPVEASPTRPGETWVRGRGLGGSSAVNGMVYCRGQPEDYDDWSRFGVRGWGWSDMEPAFKAIEDRQSDPGPTPDPRRPLAISTRRLAPELEGAIQAAARSSGLQALGTLNGPDRAGIGLYDHTIDRRGVRSSADRAFLRSARRRRNLSILAQTQAETLEIVEGRTTGVLVRHGGRRRPLHARREVIVCAGALESPLLLQRSGIGPGALLSRLGIAVVQDNPAVGANMGEHLVLALPYRLNLVAGHNREFRGARLLLNVLRYYTLRQGVLTYGACEMGGFVRSHPGVDRPDVQLAMSPYSFLPRGAGRPPRPDLEPGFTIIGYMLRPTSRGHVELASTAMDTPPRIDPNWLGTRADENTAVAMMSRMRAFVHQPGLAAYVGEALSPTASATRPDEMLAAFRRHFSCGLHAVGTCRMGSGEGAVVDQRMKVIGVDGLRVIDASVIPSPLSGNTNGPVMAMAWLAGERMRQGK